MRLVQHWIFIALIAGSSSFPAEVVDAEPNDGPSRSEFFNPPAEARPRVWWHWLNGNVTEEGVRLDLEWMKRIGIGGVQNFDASFNRGGAFNTPQIVERPITYLTPEWRHTFRLSVELAKSLGLEFAIASSPGWSQTGGPWVQPQEAMKKLVWSETYIKGGKPFNGQLAPPPAITGPFQNIPIGSHGAPAAKSGYEPQFYADIATFAYRTTPAETGSLNRKATIAVSAGHPDVARWSDGDLATDLELPFSQEKTSWVLFSFKSPERVQAVSIVMKRPPGLSVHEARNGWVEASEDGRGYRRVANLLRSDAIQQTVSFPETRARSVRVVLERPEPTIAEQSGVAARAAAFHISELVLHGAARVHRYEDKAGFSNWRIFDEDVTPSNAAGIARSDVIDVSSRMRSNGTLDWTPPQGDWMIIRLGYSLTGQINRPASTAGTGLEVDKLNKTHVKAYMDRYLKEYEAALGPQLFGPSGLGFMVTDSYEAGAQNWTENMLAEFQRLRGYDARPWLLTLTGRVIDSAVNSDRFLWDFRRTLSDLLAQSHFGQISQSLHERGLLRYGESHEVGRSMIADGMEVKKSADIPMGAMWAAAPPTLLPEVHDADIRESASVAHVYGKKLVAAESLTAYGNAYGFSPEMLKPVADREMAMGLNQFVIHTSVHQPEQRPGPGLGLGPFGQWFTRKETWAEAAGGWINYLSRSAYLLQQGQFVADIAYLYGEDVNVTALFDETAVPVPNGHNFDFVNADALVNELFVADGRIRTRSGMRYQLLALDASVTRPSLRVLRKLRELVYAGATLVGRVPTDSPSLADDLAEWQAIVGELWGSSAGERRVGQGRVFAGLSLAEALKALAMPTDFEWRADMPLTVRFVHRAWAGGDLYFLASTGGKASSIEASFRMTGRLPEIWRADTGVISGVSYRIENGRTIIPLRLEPNDAVFVVFSDRAERNQRLVREPKPHELARVTGPWTLRFPLTGDASQEIRLDLLSSWTESSDPSVKYFSGTATYETTFEVKRRWLSAYPTIHIDLGEVKQLARLIVNGRVFDVSWKTPFTQNITPALRVGKNEIQVEVTNLWPNRLIGDKQPGAKPTVFASFDPFDAGSPLIPSGLLGPVRLVAFQ